MSYDGRLAERVEQALAGCLNVTERKMMGALCFMVDGHMCCGVTGEALMIRVGRDAYERTLAEPHVRPMTIADRHMSGFVTVDADGGLSDSALQAWVRRGVDFVSTLPPKRTP